jgi:hypothetical protein
MLGQKVTTLVNEIKERGSYSVNFDASGLSNGIYIYRLKTNNFREVRKMTLMK